MAQVKLLSTTAILTMLIWASADSLVNEEVTVRVVLEPVPQAGIANLLVTPRAEDKPFEVQISGPRRTINEIRAQAPFQVRYPIADLPTGLHHNSSATDHEARRGNVRIRERGVPILLTRLSAIGAVTLVFDVVGQAHRVEAGETADENTHETETEHPATGCEQYRRIFCCRRVGFLVPRLRA